jgi:hypothetical protein
MKIAKSDKYKYLGWQNGYHRLRNLKFESIELVTEAKYIDVSTDAVLMLKSDGTIEPSHGSSRRVSKATLDSLVLNLSVL